MPTFIESSGFVSIVGAGPGHPDYLTRKGERRLAEADLVLYDALLSDEFYALFPAKAQRLYVGKRCGHHSFTQDDINRLLVRSARQGKTVVRLKGGDPLLFGRGGEEAQALRAAGVAYEIVPGVSAAQGVGALVGLPLTHRGVARSALLVEAHDLETVPPDWVVLARLAAADGTVVFYMATRFLQRIAQELLRHGVPGRVPLALVETSPEQRQVVQTTRLETAALAGLTKRTSGPGLIYVGQAVGLINELAWRGGDSRPVPTPASASGGRR